MTIQPEVANDRPSRRRTALDAPSLHAHTVITATNNVAPEMKTAILSIVAGLLTLATLGLVAAVLEWVIVYGAPAATTAGAMLAIIFAGFTGAGASVAYSAAKGD